MSKASSSSWEWYRTEETLNIPLTTTQYEMANGYVRISRQRDKKHMLSFQAIDPDDFAASGRFLVGLDYRKDPISLTTTYRSSFGPRVSASKCKPKETPADQPAPDFLWNRRAKTVFQFQPWSEHKFMDDQFSRKSAGAKKIDFFRQLRNAPFHGNNDP